jgi:hypothetical protein
VARTQLEEQVGALEHFVSEPPSDAPPRLRVIHTGDAPSDPADSGSVLRGARIREVAVQVLNEAGQDQAPIHYKTWFELLSARGFVTAGKDPLATFLTQIGRSPVVRRSTAAGTYSLDVTFVERARREVAILRAELQAATELSPQASVAEIAEARVRRAELSAEVDAIERALEEALRSLGDPPHGSP